MPPTLAQQHVTLLGLPPVVGSYEKDDAWQVLQGRHVEPIVADSVHDRLACTVGALVLNHLNAKFPRLRWTPERFLVRTIRHGESSASFRSFGNGSRLVLVSRLLQETLIVTANVIEYFDLATSLARLSLRRRNRERQMLRASARVTAVLRYLLLAQRLTGRTPAAFAVLDQKSATVAGQLAAGAGMFVVAHEIGHIAFNHEAPSTAIHDEASGVTVSELQELQADNFAFGLLRDLMSDDPEAVLWSAFIALFAATPSFSRLRALALPPNTCAGKTSMTGEQAAELAQLSEPELLRPGSGKSCSAPGSASGLRIPVASDDLLNAGSKSALRISVRRSVMTRV